MHKRKTHHTFWLSLTFLHVQYYFFPKKIFIFILELSTELGTYRVVRYEKNYLNSIKSLFFMNEKSIRYYSSSFFHIRFVDIYQLLVYHLESHQQDAMSTGQRFNYSPPLSLHAIYYAQENSVAREKEDKERKVLR